MLTRRLVIKTTAGTLAAPAIVRAQATSAPIVIGDINSYTAEPASTLPYRNGWQLALEQVNAAGGLLGRKLEIVSRDDAGHPQDAVRIAGELVGDAKATLLAGTVSSVVAVAVSDFALRNRTLFVAGQPLTDAVIWARGNRYTFRVRPGIYQQANMLVGEAAKLPARSWATVSPGDDDGQAAVGWFKRLLGARRPDVMLAAEQRLAPGRIAATVGALAAAKPDAICNAASGADLIEFVRAGTASGLFENRTVVSILAGEPEYLAALGTGTPAGWIVTGYPVDGLDTPEHKAFADAYRAEFTDSPQYSSVIGYAMVNAVAAGILRSGSTDTETMVEAFRGAAFSTPFGRASVRALDHQSTLGAFVGTLAVKDGKGMMADWHYVDGADALPPDAEVRAMRPAP